MKIMLNQFILILLLSACTLAGNITLSTDYNLPAPDPDPADIITIYLNNNSSLFLLDVTVKLSGDAALVETMDENNCDQYGWGDTSGPVAIVNDNQITFSCVSWSGNTNNTIAYLKFRCNSGRVSVFIDEEKSNAFSWGEDYFLSDEVISVGTLTLPPLIEQQTIESVLTENPDDIEGEPRGETTGIEWPIPAPPINPLAPPPAIKVIDYDITENTVWDSNDIYYIVGDPNFYHAINVQALLVIEPGTTVIMDFSAGIRVNNGGTLIAKGTPNKPIRFTPDWVYFEYPDYVGLYWQAYPMFGAYYHCPIVVEPTASPLTTAKYCMIEGALIGIIIDNVTLYEPIENNRLCGNTWGIYEWGPELTDIKNNLLFLQDQASITVRLCPDPNDLADLHNEVEITQNTCDGLDFTYRGISIHGVADPNYSGIPKIHLTNNIVSKNFHYGLNLADGAMKAIIIGTGYFGNGQNKNWNFPEYNPVIEQNDPYPSLDFDHPLLHHYLHQDSTFVNAGLEWIEETELIGTKTSANDEPDKDKVDLGYHHPMWNYIGGEGIAGTNIDDLNIICEYWLCSDPYDVNSPGYDLSVFDPNSPNYITDPNLLIFDGDLTGDGYVDYRDLAKLSLTWFTKPKIPNLQAVIEGNPDNGKFYLSVSGANKDTVFVYALVNGRYIGEVFALGEPIQIRVDLSDSGNLTHEIKFLAVDLKGHYSFSGITKITRNSQLSYCFLPTIYEPNEPIPFVAYNTGTGDSTVEVHSNGGQVVWSQDFPDNTINGFIPADITGITSVIDGVHFCSIGGDNNRATFPSVPAGDIDIRTNALLVMPDQNIFDEESKIRLTVINSFISTGLKFARLEGSEATWKNIARYGQHSYLKYIFFSGHGDYRLDVSDDPNNPTWIYRTRQKLAGGRVYSAKASEYSKPPTWLVPFPPIIERSAKTWASMQFDNLRICYFDTCFGGHLKINSRDELIESEPGFKGISYDGPFSDIALALNLNNSFKPRAYHGWYNYGYYGISTTDNDRTSYGDWTVDFWEKLGHFANFKDAVDEAIKKTEWQGELSAFKNFRLKGQGPMNYIRLSHVLTD